MAETAEKRLSTMEMPSLEQKWSESIRVPSTEYAKYPNISCRWGYSDLYPNEKSVSILNLFMTIQSLMLCSTNCSLTEALRARESVSRQKYGNSHLTVHPVTVQKQKVNDFLTFVKYLCIIYSMTAVILCAQNGKFSHGQTAQRGKFLHGQTAQRGKRA